MKQEPNKILQLFLAGLLAGCLLLDVSHAVVYGAGFDCTKAATDAEHYICANDQLNGLDGLLARVYVANLKRLATTKQNKLKQTQRAWLHKRDSCMGYLPAEQWFCMLNAYKKRIVDLGGMQPLIAYYKTLCAKDDWKCITVGDLERARGNLDEAIHYYSIMCKADYDGDGGETCYKKAILLETQGNIDEAKALYIKTCKHRQNNEACAAAQRLTAGNKASDSWEGLYRSDEGTLFIKKEADGKYSFNMDTTWANGSMCGYTGTFTLKNGKAVVAAEKDYPDCLPKIIKDGKTLSVKDPTGKCRQLCGVRASFEDLFHKANNRAPSRKTNSERN